MTCLCLLQSEQAATARQKADEFAKAVVARLAWRR
jgi:hypothetical protein